MAEVKNTLPINCPSCDAAYKIPNTLLGKRVTCKKCHQQFDIPDQEPTKDYPLIAKIALKYKLITENQVQETLRFYNEQKQKKSFKECLVELGFISASNAEYMTSIQKACEIRQLDIRFGIIAVENNFTTQKQINQALIKQAKLFSESTHNKFIGEILVESGALTQQQRDLVIMIQKQLPKKLRFGEIALNNELISKEDLNNALIKQAKLCNKEIHSKLIGEILVESGVLTKKQCDWILMKQNRLHNECSIEYIEELSRLMIEVDKDDINEQQKDSNNQKLKNSDQDEPKEIDQIKSEINQIKENHIQHQSDTIDDSDMPNEKAENGLEDNNSDISQDDPQKEAEQKITDSIQGDETLENAAYQQEIARTEEFALLVSRDGLKASMQILHKIEEPIKLELLKDFIQQTGIVYGIKDDIEIENFLISEGLQQNNFTIAEGILPINGKDSKIKYFFDINPLKIGQLNEGGKIDFRDRGTLPHVKQDELLAELIPGKKGKPGMDVFGVPIPAPEIEENILKKGANTTLSEDNLKLFASKSGQPSLSIDGRISVLTDIAIKGDVGYETGHIDFDGNIKVSGTIQSGFKVKCADLIAHEILEAQIQTTGDIYITNGITGAVINTMGSVHAKYINKSTISAYGEIIVQKEILDSKVVTSGACKVQRGKIISSEISSKLGIESIDIGTEISRPCKLRTGVEDHINGQVDKINIVINEKKDAIKELYDKVQDLETKEKNTHIQISKIAQAQDAALRAKRGLQKQLADKDNKNNKDKIQKELDLLTDKGKEFDSTIEKFFAEQDRLLEEIQTIKEEIQHIESILEEEISKKKAILEWSKKAKRLSVVKAKGTIFVGTIISGKYTTTILKENISRSRVNEVRSHDPNAIASWEMKVSHL